MANDTTLFLVNNDDEINIHELTMSFYHEGILCLGSADHHWISKQCDDFAH